MEEQTVIEAPGAAEVDALHERVQELESTLAQAREALDASERRREIDVALMKADAVDLESARLLTEAAVAQMEEPDVDAAVGELRRRKVFLFRSRGPSSVSAAMAGRSGVENGAGAEAARAAEVAAETGDRGALLRYLRARRGVG